MPGIIVPRKTVGEVQRLIEDLDAEVTIELSQAKIRFTIGDVVLTSKLIDGTFPDYGRVIPAGNDKELDGRQAGIRGRRRPRLDGLERARPRREARARRRASWCCPSPTRIPAAPPRRLEVEYDSDPIDIGFNSRYLLDIAAQIDGDVAVLKLADPGSPTLIQDKDAKGALYVLMPMRV